MTTILFTLAGVGLVLLVVYDVYATILHSRSRSGPIAEPLNSIIWRTVLAVAFKLSRSTRHRLLNSVGPLLLPLLIVIYILTLIVGFATIYYPRMPAEFIFSPQATGGGWMDAVYFSGVTLITVGYGDIAPHSTAMRLVSLFQALSGFALISLAITYLITVYGQLERKRVAALAFYYHSEQGADAAGFIANHFVEDKFHGLEATLRIASREMQLILESHTEHSVLHYFHPIEVHKSLPRMMFLVLEICTVIRSCLDTQVYAETGNHPAVMMLEASGRHVLGELYAMLDLERRKTRREETPGIDEKRWRLRFNQSILRLKIAGIKTRPDQEAAWELYRTRREEWESQLHRLANYTGYDWNEVTGDRDLREAAEEMDDTGDWGEKEREKKKVKR